MLINVTEIYCIMENTTLKVITATRLFHVIYIYVIETRQSSVAAVISSLHAGRSDFNEIA